MRFMNLLRRGLYPAFAIIALSVSDCLRANSLYDFVRNFPFAEQESVIQLPYSASDIDLPPRLLPAVSLDCLLSGAVARSLLRERRADRRAELFPARWSARGLLRTDRMRLGPTYPRPILSCTAPLSDRIRHRWPPLLSSATETSSHPVRPVHSRTRLWRLLELSDRCQLPGSRRSRLVRETSPG